MKICFLTHNLRQDNGAGVFSKRLIEGVRKRTGAEVVALTSVGSKETYDKSILYPGSRSRLFSQLLEVRREIKQCDIVHALDAYPYGIIAFLASIGLKKRRIVTATGTGSIGELYKRFSWLLRQVYRKADVVTAISNFTKQEILKKVPRLNIQVINHGVDFEEFQKPVKDEVALQYKPYILSVGTVRWRKGYKLSIPAFAEVSRKFPDLKYVIVGKYYKEKYTREVAEIIKECGLQEKVVVLDKVDARDELIALYKNAEVFGLLSQNLNRDVEGFGLVFLEAAAAGLPVIGSKNCGVEDAVQNGENGILVHHRSSEEFRDALIKILSDKNLKKSMSQKSLKFARESTWERRIGEYINLYKNTA